MVFLAIFLGVIVTIALMPAFIKFLRSHLIGQPVRADGPESHLVKQGTPTMGGVIMLIAATIVVAILAEPVPETWLIMGAVLATGALGLFDDASKVAHERSLGLTPKAKLVGQFLIASAFVLAAVNWLGVAPTVEIPFVCTFDLGVFTTTLPIEVPAGGDFSIPWLYLIFADILLAGMSNATNLTDGLDGLLSGTFMVVIVVMAAIAFRAGLLDSAIVAAALAGCCIGFLWYNSYPADIFMGDTGSLALGTALGCLAIVSRDRNSFHYYWRSFCSGNAVRYDPGVLLQAHTQALVLDGSPSSSLRKEGLERSKGCYSLLDYFCRTCSSWFLSVFCSIAYGVDTCRKSLTQQHHLIKQKSMRLLF